MGRRGPKPAPTALKIASGVRADRINADSPTAVVAVPDCPFALSPEAAAEWDRVVPLLAEMQVLARIDAVALVIHCEAWSDYVEARRMLRNLDKVVDGMGAPQANAWMRIQKDAADTMRRSMDSFGMTPSARSSIRLDGAAAAKAQAETDGVEAWRKARKVQKGKKAVAS